MKKILQKLGYVKQSGKVDWEEVKFDAIIYTFLGVIFWVLIHG